MPGVRVSERRNRTGAVGGSNSRVNDLPEDRALRERPTLTREGCPTHLRKPLTIPERRTTTPARTKMRDKEKPECTQALYV